MVCHYSSNLHVSYGTMAFLNQTITFFFFFFCRRNCKGNPNCLVGIGEHIWLGEIDENSFHNIDDPNCERRKKVSRPFLSDHYGVFLWVFCLFVLFFLFCFASVIRNYY